MDEGTIEAVLFDAVGTLFHSRGTVGDIYRSVAIKYGSDIPACTLQSGFVRETAKRGTPINKEDWKALVQTVFSQHGPFPRFEEFFKDMYAFFQSGRSWMCYPETETVLMALADRKYRMGVVSNFDDRLFDVLKDLEIDRFFSAVVIPASAGQAKPEPGIFVDAITQLDVAPERALFVGDDPYLDVAAAQTAGLNAILVAREHSTPPAPAIGDLTGLLSILSVA
jgi:putative hydrolase of the HAD superfamily